MKTSMLRTAFLAVLALGFSTQASAQLGGVLNRARNRVQQAAQQTVEDARQSVEDATVGEAKRTGKRVQQQVQQTVDNAVDATVGQAQRTVNGAVQGVTNRVQGAVDGAVDATVGRAQRTVDGAVQGVTNRVQGAVDNAVDATVGRAQRTVDGAVQGVTDRVQGAVDGAVDATVGRAQRTIDGAVQGVTDRVQGAVDNAVDATVGRAQRSVYGAIDGVTGTVQRTIDGAANAVTQPIVGAVDGITESATGAVATAVDGAYQSVMARTQAGRADKQAASYGTFPAADKVYKPSKKAAQADASAAAPEVPEGHTKSIAAIHAAYEHLDAKLYPYQPYYQFPDYYVMHSGSSQRLLDHDWNQLMGQSFLAAGTTSKVQILSLRRVTVPKHREGRNFFDETVRNAYTALFVADPISMEGFTTFVRALVLDDPRACPIEYPMDDPAKGIISEADNFQLAFKSYDGFIKMRNDRRDQALHIARSQTPINVVRNAIHQWLDAIPEATDAKERYTLYWLANEAYEEVLTQHDKYVGGDDANLQLGQKLSAAREMYADIITEGQLERMEGQTLPTSHNIKGINDAKLLAAAQAAVPEGAEVVRVLCLDKAWKTTAKQRTLNVGVLTQVGKFQFLFPRTLTEAKKGRNWSGVYTVSGDGAPYKVK